MCCINDKVLWCFRKAPPHYVRDTLVVNTAARADVLGWLLTGRSERRAAGPCVAPGLCGRRRGYTDVVCLHQPCGGAVLAQCTCGAAKSVSGGLPSPWPRSVQVQRRREGGTGQHSTGWRSDLWGRRLSVERRGAPIAATQLPASCAPSRTLGRGSASRDPQHGHKQLRAAPHRRGWRVDSGAQNWPLQPPVQPPRRGQRGR